MNGASVDKLPEYVAISPITLVCPRCHAEPGDSCEVLLGKGLEDRSRRADQSSGGGRFYSQRPLEQELTIYCGSNSKPEFRNLSRGFVTEPGALGRDRFQAISVRVRRGREIGAM
jgi:hypothetical protein